MERRKHARKALLPYSRPSRHRRIVSNSPEAWDDPPLSPRSHGSDEPFHFSPVGTPRESPFLRLKAPTYADDAGDEGVGDFVSEDINTSAPEDLPGTSQCLGISPNCTSSPIAIKQPTARKADPTSAAPSMPLAALSARGDIPGGYFPLHEDPKSRSRAPHPFREAAEKARRASLRRAAESSNSGADGRRLRTSDTPEPPQPAWTSDSSPSTSSSTTPISSYMPSGLLDDVVVPTGKYYPSNWERRHRKTTQLGSSTETQPSVSASRSESEPQVLQYQSPQQHAGPGSDARQRLRQYQRDMVAQAAMAASAILASNSSAASPVAASSLGMVPLPGGLLPLNLPKTHKPVAPKLRPVGSPGPVTPISLDADCYLSPKPSVCEESGRQMADDADVGSTGAGREYAGDTRSPTNRAVSV